jgi:hypothetical protein
MTKTTDKSVKTAEDSRVAAAAGGNAAFAVLLSMVVIVFLIGQRAASRATPANHRHHHLGAKKKQRRRQQNGDYIRGRVLYSDGTPYQKRHGREESNRDITFTPTPRAGLSLPGSFRGAYIRVFQENGWWPPAMCASSAKNLSPRRKLSKDDQTISS